MTDKLFGSITPLEKGLDASWLRNQVIVNNIANGDTPGFKTSTVTFEDAFGQALERARVGTKNPDMIRAGSALAEVDPQVNVSGETVMRTDGSNIDIDAENAELARNTIYYNTLVQKLGSELDKLRMAINEGR